MPLLFLLLTLLLAGCARPVSGPPELRLGEDECARCRMVVDQERYAAARVTPEGVEVYDDLGELFVHRREVPRPDEQLWVRDYQGAGWLEARQAFYVAAKDLTTPMGFGVVAVATQERALTLAVQVRGQTRRFKDLEKEGTAHE